MEGDKGTVLVGREREARRGLIGIGGVGLYRVRVRYLQSEGTVSDPIQLRYLRVGNNIVQPDSNPKYVLFSVTPSKSSQERLPNFLSAGD